jgi:hypothetical protein
VCRTQELITVFIPIKKVVKDNNTIYKVKIRYFYKNIYLKVIYVYFYESILKINLFIWFSYF